jgi:putative ABC transport system permease protein
MTTFAVELRDSARSLRRDRGFSLTVVLTLAVTIGATTAAFSIVNGILIKPLAYPEPDRLVALREVWREVPSSASGFPVNQRHFEYWRQNARLFESMTQFLTLPANLTSGGPATQIAVVQASGTLFETLGETAALGRLLAPDDDRAGQPDMAVIGDALWKQRFGASPAVLGGAMVIDGRPFTVIGVLPPTFRLPEGQRLIATVDAVIPMRIEAGWMGDHNNSAIGRLRPGVSLDQARAELDVLQTQAGEIASRESGQTVTLAGSVTPLDESIVGRSRRSVLLLFGAVVTLMAIACSNLTNLALIRATARTRDVAIRSALGAGRWRLLARSLLDFGLLAAAGGALGIWIAYAALHVFVQTAPLDLPRLDEAAIDPRVILFAFAVTGATGLFVAILPLLHIGAQDPQAALRSGSAGAGQGRAGMRARTVLTAVQVALAVTLLTVTTLLGASLLRVLDIEHGFNTDHVMSMAVGLPSARYADDGSRVAAFDRLLAAVAALPGVRHVSSTSLLPMRGEGQVNFIVADGTNVPRPEQPGANFRLISPDYFSVMELPIQRGRMFSLNERQRPLTPSVISASVAKRLWPGQEPLGKTFSRGLEGEPGFEVVGIAADARTTSLERTPPLMVYVPYWWQTRTNLSLLVKTQVDPLTLAPAIRRAVEQVDPEIAVGQALLLQDAVNAATAARRYQARLFVVFGVVALLIATLGVYAVTAYSLSKRRREMNIRVALGARTSEVIRLLMRQTSAAVLPGVLAGIAGALALGGAISSLLYEVRPRDPIVLGTVAIGVGAAAVVAALVATRNGLSIDPAAALREE